MTESQLMEMINEQYKLNCSIAGQSWLNGVSKNGKGVNYGRAIYMEIAELIESFPWKHWKNINMDVDYLNVSIEMVDIWHFIMSATGKNSFNSLLFEAGLKFEDLTEKEIDKMWIEACKISVKTIILIQDSENTHKGFSHFIKHKTEESNYIDKEVIPFEILMEFGLDLAINNGKDIKKEFDLITAINAIFYVLIKEYILMEVYDLYNGKRILNIFRQENGYSEGTYKKHWNYNEELVEDNVVMFSLINEGFKTCDLNNVFKDVYDQS